MGNEDLGRSASQQQKKTKKTMSATSCSCAGFPRLGRCAGSPPRSSSACSSCRNGEAATCCSCCSSRTWCPWSRSAGMAAKRSSSSLLLLLPIPASLFLPSLLFSSLCASLRALSLSRCLSRSLSRTQTTQTKHTLAPQQLSFACLPACVSPARNAPSHRKLPPLACLLACFLCLLLRLAPLTCSFSALPPLGSSAECRATRLPRRRKGRGRGRRWEKSRAEAESVAMETKNKHSDRVRQNRGRRKGRGKQNREPNTGTYGTHIYIHTYVRRYVRTYSHKYVHKYVHESAHTYLCCYEERLCNILIHAWP
jgi:hypothetical protein